MLDPVLLSAIHDLEVVARVTVEGALSGLHRSPFHGYSAEFSQYRHYRPGDDLKYVDWKLFARTDRIYTKQFRETTNLRMQIVLDGSASMGFRGRAGASKLEYARLIAAGFAHLLVTQGDAAGLIVHDQEIRSYLGARAGRAHLRALLAALSRVEAQGKTGGARALRRGTDLLRTRGVLLVLSDLYDDEDGVDAELRRAARMGHDVVVFHVLTPDEIELPVRGGTEFEDAETGQTVFAGASEVAGYGERVAAFLRRWRQRCAACGIDYCQVRTDAPLDRTLRGYLLERGRAPR
ncbi:MAG: DUF58 domain-containing protein [Vicinamibacterales bacterium]